MTLHRIKGLLRKNRLVLDKDGTGWAVGHLEPKRKPLAKQRKTTVASAKGKEKARIVMILPKERPISWNTLYAGQFWTKRQQEAKRVHTLVHYSQDVLYNHSIDVYPVKITITTYFKNRPYDADNIASKFYIDGLKGRFIEDDTPEFVSSVETVSKISKEDPRVEIVIEEI